MISSDGSPTGFQGLATLPMPMPLLAARELERSVLKLGMQGAMVFGRTGSKNLDHLDYWLLFETASALNVPLYIHPQTPQRGVRDAYYSGIGKDVDRLFSTAGSVGTTRQVCRSFAWRLQVCSSVFRICRSLLGIWAKFSCSIWTGLTC